MWAAAPIRPLAWELPCAAGMALKGKKKKKRKEKGKKRKGGSNIFIITQFNTLNINFNSSVCVSDYLSPHKRMWDIEDTSKHFLQGRDFS